MWLFFLLIVVTWLLPDHVWYHWFKHWRWWPHFLTAFLGVTANCEACSIYHECKVAILLHTAYTYALWHIIHWPERLVFPSMFSTTERDVVRYDVWSADFTLSSKNNRIHCKWKHESSVKWVFRRTFKNIFYEQNSKIFISFGCW